MAAVAHSFGRVTYLNHRVLLEVFEKTYLSTAYVSLYRSLQKFGFNIASPQFYNCCPIKIKFRSKLRHQINS